MSIFDPVWGGIWGSIWEGSFVGAGGELGTELQPNWDMSQGTLGWTAAAATIQAVTDSGQDAVLITSTGTGAFDRGELAISGLEIGKVYRLNILARQGIGTGQILSTSWGSPATEIVLDSASYKNYEIDLTATATSGVTRCYAAYGPEGGATGDTIYVSQVSIREVL